MKKCIFILSIICYGFTTNNVRPIHVFMIGDSTMANKVVSAIPEYGWGQVLPYFFTESVVINNHAINGYSSKSFIDEGKWDEVIANVQKGDYVIIQFGHNDQKKDIERHTSPFDTYKGNLIRFINETKAKGGIPILCTSIVRRHFKADGMLKNTHGDYLTAVKEVADETSVYFLDMEAKSKQLIESLRKEKSKVLFLHFESNTYPMRSNEVHDNTHLSQLGAFKIAGLAIQNMKELAIPLTRHVANKN